MAKEMEITDDYLQAVIDGDVAKIEAHERGKKDVEIGFGWSFFGVQTSNLDLVHVFSFFFPKHEFLCKSQK